MCAPTRPRLSLLPMAVVVSSSMEAGAAECLVLLGAAVVGATARAAVPHQKDLGSGVDQSAGPVARRGTSPGTARRRPRATQSRPGVEYPRGWRGKM